MAAPRRSGLNSQPFGGREPELGHGQRVQERYVTGVVGVEGWLSAGRAGIAGAGIG